MLTRRPRIVSSEEQWQLQEFGVGLWRDFVAPRESRITPCNQVTTDTSDIVSLARQRSLRLRSTSLEVLQRGSQGPSEKNEADVRTKTICFLE